MMCVVCILSGLGIRVVLAFLVFLFACLCFKVLVVFLLFLVYGVA